MSNRTLSEEIFQHIRIYGVEKISEALLQDWAERAEKLETDGKEWVSDRWKEDHVGEFFACVTPRGTDSYFEHIAKVQENASPDVKARYVFAPFGMYPLQDGSRFVRIRPVDMEEVVRECLQIPCAYTNALDITQWYKEEDATCEE